MGAVGAVVLRPATPHSAGCQGDNTQKMKESIKGKALPPAEGKDEY